MSCIRTPCPFLFETLAWPVEICDAEYEVIDDPPTVCPYLLTRWSVVDFLLCWKRNGWYTRQTSVHTLGFDDFEPSDFYDEMYLLLNYIMITPVTNLTLSFLYITSRLKAQTPLTIASKLLLRDYTQSTGFLVPYINSRKKLSRLTYHYIPRNNRAHKRYELLTFP